MIVRLGYDRGNLTGPIVDGMCIRQSFTAEAEDMVSVAVCFATYKRTTNFGFMTLAIHGPGHVKIGSETVDVSTLCQWK